MFTYKKSIYLLTVASSFLVTSCQERVATMVPAKSSSPITTKMVQELPQSVLKHIQKIENAKFIKLNRSDFGSKPSVQDVIKKINELNTPETPLGQLLQLQPETLPNARNTYDDPPSRSVTFTNTANSQTSFDGRVTMNYNTSSNGGVSDISFVSNVTYSMFGVNWGTYTQTNTNSSTYTTSDGSIVVAFQVQGTYMAPVIGYAGMSNDWVFNGYLVFPCNPGGSGGGEPNNVFTSEIRGNCSMQINELY